MLIDRYLSQSHFSEYHATLIRANAERIYPVARGVNFFRSRLIRYLIKMRGLPIRMGTLDGFVQSGFILLQERAGLEVVLGFVLGPGGLKKVSPGDFAAFAKRGHVKGVWNLRLSPIDQSRTILSTQTRVWCSDRVTEILFSWYWAVIFPFSSLIRIAMLRLIKREVKALA